jgi:hypothetical protein
MRILVTLALLLAGCAATGESSPDTPVSCPATCQTTYTQCSGGCIGGGDTTAADCVATCDRVHEECLRSCEEPPGAQ